LIPSSVSSKRGSEYVKKKTMTFKERKLSIFYESLPINQRRLTKHSSVCSKTKPLHSIYGNETSDSSDSKIKLELAQHPNDLVNELADIFKESGLPTNWYETEGETCWEKIARVMTQPYTHQYRMFWKNLYP
jgi:hypothetical protein